MFRFYSRTWARGLCGDFLYVIHDCYKMQGSYTKMVHVSFCVLRACVVTMGGVIHGLCAKRKKERKKDGRGRSARLSVVYLSEKLRVYLENNLIFRE